MKKFVNSFSVIISILVYFLLLFIVKSDSNYLKEIKYIYILALPSFMIFINSFFRKEDKQGKINLYLYLFIYLTALFGFVFSNARGSDMTNSNIMHYNYNLIPFKSIVEVINGDLGLKFAIYNIIGNFLMLTPLSLLLPLINNKFKKISKFTIIISVLGLSIELIQYVTNIGSFDIDDFILNLTGAIVFYILIYKTKLEKYIENIFFSLKISDKKILNIILKIVINFVYYCLFIFVILSSIYNITNIFNDLKSKHVNIDVSNLVCQNNEKKYLLDYNNYHYYSACDYGDSKILANNQELNLKEFIESPYFSKYNDKSKINLIEEEIITNIIINDDNNIGKKLIYKYGDIKTYYYNIESMIIVQDGIHYDYEKYLENIKNNQKFKIDLSSLSELKYVEPNYKYTISWGKYYQFLRCSIGNRFSNSSNNYFLPLNFKITNKTCDKLNDL